MRDAVALAAVVRATGDLAILERSVHAALASGFRALVVDDDRSDASAVAATVASVRDWAGPDADLSLCLHQQFTEAEARSLYDRLSPSNLLYASDPCRAPVGAARAVGSALPSLALTWGERESGVLLDAMRDGACPVVRMVLSPTVPDCRVRAVAALCRVFQCELALVAPPADECELQRAMELAGALPACTLAVGVAWPWPGAKPPRRIFEGFRLMNGAVPPGGATMQASASSGARVTRIQLYRVRLPLRQLYVSSMYVMPDAFRTIIRMETSDGLEGWGETYGTPEAFALAVRHAKTFLGCRPRDRQKLADDFARSVFDNRNGRNGWAVHGGLELALWDLDARLAGRPVHDLIGGRHRDRVDVVCPVPALVLGEPVTRDALPDLFRDRSRIRDVVAYCQVQARAYGFRAFKYKSAGLDPEWDIATMAALREALGPDVRLRWDPNAAYPVARAIAMAARMEPLGLEFYEDPADDIAGMAAVRARVRTKLATNMCVIQPDHIAAAVRHRPADVLLADVYMWGGIENYRVMAAAAEACGFEVAVHSLFESGIGTAANLHLAAALPALRRPNDSGWHVLARDVVAAGALEVAGGAMKVPAGPGWGIGIDLDALAAATVEQNDITG